MNLFVKDGTLLASIMLHLLNQLLIFDTLSKTPLIHDLTSSPITAITLIYDDLCI